MSALQSPAVAALIEQIRAAVRLPDHPDAAAKHERLLKRLAQTVFDAGADFTRRQWDQAAQAIPRDGHDAYAAGVFQAWEIIEQSGSLEEARDRILSHAVFVAPAEAEARQARP
ncbi:hypothetical protein [Oceanicaulis sp. MMSF_3324]|uniref:hypothetical protein n=1 Tax=Oceanicaulis sp. MMSF_3324 TaxID=3046702 RepID=UPI0027400453|nr:hypothetical protein [Oceanicaulis sp. MMSF_3324]